MKVSTNIASMSAIRSLDTTSKALSRALERLASGKRINRAGDDASGLAISNGLEAQRRGMLQAVRNINDASSSLSIVDGVMAEQMNILQRMRELAMQSANGTLSSSDRSYLNAEFKQLYTEFDRLSDISEKNDFGLKVGDTTALQVGTQKGQSINLSIPTNRISRLASQYAAATDIISTTTANGTFQASNYAAPGITNSGRVLTADFNRDGKDDILAGVYQGAGGSIITYYGNGTGSFGSRSTLSLGFGQASDYAIGDFNEDGRMDAADQYPGGGGGLRIYLGQADGSLAVGPTATAPAQTARIITADINSDGHLDIVAGHLSGTSRMTVNFGNGDGTFQNSLDYLLYTNPRDVAAADFNNDGKMDLVGTDANGNGQVQFGAGDGTFPALTSLSSLVGSSNQTAVATGLFGTDSNQDILVAVGGYIKLVRGNGNGTFQAVQTIASSSGAVSFTTGDLNKDGYLDFVTANGTSNSVSIFYGKADNTFTQVDVAQDSGSNVKSVTLADLNGDGFKDIVASHGGDANLGILIAGTTTSTASTFALPPLIDTQAHSQDALGFIDYAMTQMKSSRASIGALQNRLEYAANSNSVTSENITQAKSQILDTDVAVETAELVRNQILQQAGVGVLGQANTSLQIALELLRNI